MTTFSTSREIPADAERVFAAFTDPVRHAKWWGPAGFTNTFTVREFTPGGQWVYDMFGPDGRKYPQESVFEVIEPAKTIVIRHVSEPTYRLTIGLAATKNGTVVSWSQAFDSDSIARKIEHVVVPGNEQNLDRLSAEVLGT